ncbi:MAG TPA: helix-turn-helix domain-containing protein [Rubrobacter sp.]|nr:helix-turn-helix domain-containing protein [Rubrobacter sp.]
MVSTTLVTVAEQAAEWRVSKATIYRLVREEQLPTVRLRGAGDIRFDPKDVAEWLESRKAGT